jgi:hypothetical protein
MADPGASAAFLEVTLQVAEPVVIGTSALATVRVGNRGSGPATVSARLNLMEGDVRLLVTGPDGDTRDVAGTGGQPDTGLRQVQLAPGEQITAAVNLLDTSVGPLFTEPGGYTLRVRYWPTPGVEPVESLPVTVTARAPETEVERGVAALLQDEGLRRALALGQGDDATDSLRQLAAGFAGTLDGELASLLLAGGALAAGAQADAAAGALQVADPEGVALRLTALATPFSYTGPMLTDAFAASLSARAGAGADAGSATASPALKIARGEPFRAGP